MSGPPGLGPDIVFVCPGDEIFAVGEEASCAYLVEDGLVDIVLPGPPFRLVATRGAGELFGEMAIIDGARRSASAVARSAGRLLRIDATRISRFLDSSDPVLRMVVGTVLERMRETMSGASASGASAAPVQSMTDETRREAIMLRAVLQIRRESDLRKGLERGELTLHHQPIVSLADGRVVGFEALARWNHPELGKIAPSEFIPLAESSGLIGALTRHCLEEGARALHVFDREAAAGSRFKPFLNVNVSAFDLLDPDFPVFLTELAARWPIIRGRLKIEITESALMTDPAMALRALERCRALGLGVAIDDFGTGYSSLSYLHRLPIDVLKIDQSFIRGMAADGHSAKIIRTILRLAEEIGVPVVSEGLELPAEVSALARMGCGFGQGYHFARPMPLAETGRFMADWIAVRSDAA